MFSTAVLLSAVFLTLCGHGGESGGESGEFQYSTGPFTITYNPQALPSLHIDWEGKPIWFTSVSSTKPFIYAEMVSIEEKQIGGDYTIHSKVLDTCLKLNVTAIGSRPAAQEEQIVFLLGKLCDKVDVELDFQAVTVFDSTTINGTATNFTHLQFHISMDENSYYNSLRLVYGSETDEKFYGFGAQYSKLNMKGQRLPLFLSEQGVGRGLEPITVILDLLSRNAGGTWYTTYTRVPHYITSHQRSIYLQSLEYTVFDLTLPDTVTIEVNSSTVTGRLIPGHSPLDIITSYTSLVGRLPPLPQWVGQGAVLGLQGGTEAVEDTVFGTVMRGWGNLSDVAAVWLQDWTGQRNFSGANELPRVGLWWNWEVDLKHYPDWTKFVDSLKSKGIQTLVYINPLFSNVSLRGTPYQHNYYEEGLEKGYFVRTSDGEFWKGYSGSVLLDLSNQEAYQWMVNIIVQNMLATGVCGWMCDFGESVPLDAQVHGNMTAQEFHSMYPSVWGQLNKDAIEKARNMGGVSCSSDDVVYFMRSGNARSPATTRLFWLGDQMVTWDAHDGLATVVMGMLSQGLSGYSMTHSDIGGYTALLKKPFIKYLRSRELYLRWCELAAFSCMYRSHMGTLPVQNWQFDDDQQTLQHFFKMAVLFKSWSFYRDTLMEEAASYGWPVARHMMLVFPNNSLVYAEEMDQQFMVGTELLVAPVMSAGQESVKVFLPGGVQWVWLWDITQLYTGGDAYVTIPAPIGKPCVLFRKDSEVGAKFVANLKSRNML